MVGKNFKVVVSLVLTVALVVPCLFTGCGDSTKKTDNSASAQVTEKKDSTAASTAASTAKDTKPVEKSKVLFQYLWGGETGKFIQTRVEHYNKMQDKYEVEGLSVPDKQKIIVSISSGNGPDLTDDFSNEVAGYADKSVAEPLDEYINRDNKEYKIEDFVPAALESCKYKGKTYAIPCSINFLMLFYNKKLFAEAGIKEPPKTDKELLEYAIKLTKVNSDKTIDVLGFPDFPIVYYRNPMSAAFGAEYISKDGKTLTPDNPATIKALNLIVEYVKKFGYENVAKFRAAGKYLDATDPFFTGHQAMRIDGMWFGSKVKNELKLTKDQLDYGIAPLPYPDGHPELAGGNDISSSIFYIPKNAKNKEGAWDFLKWYTGVDEMQVINPVAAGFPPRYSSIKAPIYQQVADFADFAKVADSKNLKLFPSLPIQKEYGTIIDDECELVMNLKKTPEQAMKDAAVKANKLMQEVK